MDIEQNKLDSIKDFLEDKFDHYIDILKNMVEINSYTENAAGVNNLGDYTTSVFSELGFNTSFIESTNPQYGRHLVCKKGAGTKSLVCLSHLDTVFSDTEEKRNDFTWRMEGDKVYGPGTVDIKGGTVVMLMMFDVLCEFYPELMKSMNWILLFNSSEETSSADFEKICDDYIDDQTRACLVFEGGTDNNNIFPIVTSRKGRAVFKILTEGKSAHSGVNHMAGANAIVELADIVSEISKITDYNKDVTCNIGKINGGNTVNTVPDLCEAQIELRSYTTEDFESGIEKVLSFNDYSKVTSGDGSYTCNTKVDIQRKVKVWPKNKNTDRLYSYYEKAASAIGLNIRPESRGGLSDGNLTWDLCPTIDGLGPVGGNAHCSIHDVDNSKEQEYAVLSSFIPKAMINIIMVQFFLKEEG